MRQKIFMILGLLCFVILAALHLHVGHFTLLMKSVEGLQRHDSEFIINGSQEESSKQDQEIKVSLWNEGRSVNSEDPLGPRSWKEKTRLRFMARRNHLQERCKALNGRRLPKELNHLAPQVYRYVPKYDLLVAGLPKAGGSTWRNLVKALKQESPSSVGADSNKVVQTSTRKKPKSLMEMLTSGSHVQVVSVRHPLARLISAYKNKLGGGRASPRRPRFLEYRQVVEVLKSHGTEIVNNSVPFTQYLRVIIYQYENGTEAMNPHWRPYSSLSLPCNSSYKYIMHLETFSEDLQYVFDQIGVTRVNSNKHLNAEQYTPREKNYDNYYKDLPKRFLQVLYEIYKYDFDLFDYEVPQYMKEAM